MGLIKSIVNAAGGVLADQWVDFFTCDSMPHEVLMRPGTKPQQARSGNVKHSENIISNGSKINVADGQCMLIIENGKIADYCAEPGQYTYNNAIQPSLLGGGLKDLGPSFIQVGKRFLAGGAPTDQQKIYFINIKESIGNKIGWGNIPFRDSEFHMTVRVQGFGQYSFKITNPLLFYANIAGNTIGEYRRDSLTSQMKSEVISALQPALGRIAQQGIAYDMLINYPREIGEALNGEMSAEWAERRGIEIVSLAMESVTVDEQSAKKIEQLQEARALSNPVMAAGRLAAGQATAMESAGENPGGAIGAFMGMGMAQNAGGMNAAGLFQMGGGQTDGVPQPPMMPQTPQAPQNPPVPSAPEASAAEGWTCGACGHAGNPGKFCMECGTKQPEAPAGWTCAACGHAGNPGRFCTECGAKKAAACPGCSWTAPDGDNPPKFCPECGTKI
ncbi:MAG: SPFH domain-containing protein [Oscillospiraceae bacterium]|jgi:membrane protease subunit (stomatin/prohibitin family)|nr:SPFH domain-containing protein [Oscillospiraceae bacterium]